MSLLDLQQKVTDELKSATFSITGFTAQKKFVPEARLSELEDLKVFVVPGSVMLGRRDRDSREDTLVVEVGILQRIHDAVTEEQVLNFVREIADHFFERDLVVFLFLDNIIQLNLNLRTCQVFLNFVNVI